MPCILAEGYEVQGASTAYSVSKEVSHKLCVRDARIRRRRARHGIEGGLRTRTSAIRDGGLLIAATKPSTPAFLACRPSLIALMTSHEHRVFVPTVGRQSQRTLTRLRLHVAQPNLDFLCDLFTRKLGKSRSRISLFTTCMDSIATQLCFVNC